MLKLYRQYSFVLILFFCYLNFESINLLKSFKRVSTILSISLIKSFIIKSLKALKHPKKYKIIIEGNGVLPGEVYFLPMGTLLLF